MEMTNDPVLQRPRNVDTTVAYMWGPLMALNIKFLATLGTVNRGLDKLHSSKLVINLSSTCHQYCPLSLQQKMVIAMTNPWTQNNAVHLTTPWSSTAVPFHWVSPVPTS